MGGILTKFWNGFIWVITFGHYPKQPFEKEEVRLSTVKSEYDKEIKDVKAKLTDARKSLEEKEKRVTEGKVSDDEKTDLLRDIKGLRSRVAHLSARVKVLHDKITTADDYIEKILLFRSTRPVPVSERLRTMTRELNAACDTITVAADEASVGVQELADISFNDEEELAALEREILEKRQAIAVQPAAASPLPIAPKLPVDEKNHAPKVIDLPKPEIVQDRRPETDCESA